MPKYLGVQYPAFLRAAFGVKGPADLVSYFFLRAAAILRKGGCFGLLATNSISETVNADASLGPLVASGITLYFAVKAMPWPGRASVAVAVVVGTSQPWAGEVRLAGERVSRIGATLDAADTGSRRTRSLSQAFRFSQGTNLFGQAFLRQASELKELCAANPGLSKFLRKYVNGDTLNDAPEQVGDAYVIDFGERDRVDLPGCEQIVEELVAAVGYERRNQTRQIHESRPWLHWDKRTAFYEGVRKHKFMYATTIVSQFYVIHHVETKHLYAHGVELFDTESFADFAVLQSSLHEHWTRFRSGSLGKTTRYTASKCLATFPFPGERLNDLENAGRALLSFRKQLMITRRVGSNALYRAFHAGDGSDRDAAELRELHVALDYAVARAYQWDDVRLDHGYRAAASVPRFGIAEEARREVIRRLSDLNLARAEGTTNRRHQSRSSKACA